MKKVTAAILTKGNKILIAKRSATDKLADKWEFPGGKVEAGETPKECLTREMKEEFQIDVKVKDFFARSVYTYESGTIELLAYWAVTDDTNLRPMVHDEYQWVRPEELEQFDFAPADIEFVHQLKYKSLTKNR